MEYWQAGHLFFEDVYIGFFEVVESKYLTDLETNCLNFCLKICQKVKVSHVCKDNIVHILTEHDLTEHY